MMSDNTRHNLCCLDWGMSNAIQTNANTRTTTMETDTLTTRVD